MPPLLRRPLLPARPHASVAATPLPLPAPPLQLLMSARRMRDVSPKNL
jgi:hypothetical protein